MPDSTETLEAEVARLRETLAATSAVVPLAWKLTSTETRIFKVLLACEIATRDAITESTGVGAYKTQGVHLSRIRPKLAVHNVEIETVQGKGWRLVNREAWRSMLTPPVAA